MLSVVVMKKGASLRPSLRVTDGIRTRDVLDHNQVLYRAELRPPCLE